MTDVAEGVDGAAEIFRTTLPSDDAGAETADRFEWQASIATADVLGVYADWLSAEHPDGSQDATTMICEWHEDWAITGSGSVEIVSAKHKEPAYGAYTTIGKLLKDGGVLHLLRRWIALAQVPQCRLVTTAGLSGDAREIERAGKYLRDIGLSSDAATSFDQVVDRLLGAIRDIDAALLVDRAVLVRFLGCLRIDHGLPSREWVRYGAPSGFAAPVARLLGRPDAEETVWSAVLAIVRTKMRAAGPSLREALPTVLGQAGTLDLTSRTVTLEEIDYAVSFALTHPRGYQLPPRSFDLSRMGVKLTVGRLSDNVITHAKRLRLRYARLREAAAEVPGEQEQLARIEDRLLRIVREAEQVAPTGPDLWREIERRIVAVAETDMVGNMDADMLVGAIADLCHRCQVWFSDSFDVKAMRQSLQVSGGAR